MTVTTLSVNIFTSSTPIIGHNSRENNSVIIIIIAAVIFSILLLLLIVGIIVTSSLIVYHQKKKKGKTNLVVLNDNSIGYFKQSNTLKETSTNVSEVPCDDISNPIYEGNYINYIYLIKVHVITIMTHSSYIYS